MRPHYLTRPSAPTTSKYPSPPAHEPSAPNAPSSLSSAVLLLSHYTPLRSQQPSDSVGDISIQCIYLTLCQVRGRNTLTQSTMQLARQVGTATSPCAGTRAAGALLAGTSLLCGAPRGDAISTMVIIDVHQ